VIFGENISSAMMSTVPAVRSNFSRIRPPWTARSDRCTKMIAHIGLGLIYIVIVLFLIFVDNGVAIVVITLTNPPITNVRGI